MSNKKEEKKGPLKLTDLPKGLQQKYKNSIVFQRQYKQPEKKFEFDPQKIKKRKIQKQKTIEEKLKQFQINPTQAKHLYNVFYLLSQNRSVFGHAQITEVLKKMQMTLTGQQIDRMIWEFDQDLDKQISFEEFEKMYKKCMMDKAAAEPKKLFHLAQFLMYCKQGRYRITVEDTLQLLYVRALEESEKTKVPVKDIFEDSIKIIFGDNYEADNNGVEKEISFHEYLQKINQKAIQKRKKEIQKIKSQLRYS